MLFILGLTNCRQLKEMLWRGMEKSAITLFEIQFSKLKGAVKKRKDFPLKKKKTNQNIGDTTKWKDFGIKDVSIDAKCLSRQPIEGVVVGEMSSQFEVSHPTIYKQFFFTTVMQINGKQVLDSN